MDNFMKACDLWETEGREAEHPYFYFGWLSNQMPGYPGTINIRTLVQTQPVGTRPLVRVVEEGHPLAVDQAQGVSRDRFRELLHHAQQSEGAA